MKFLEQLRSRQPGSTVAYHLEGLLDANEKIHSWIVKLGEIPEEDRAVQAETITLLQVEIYSHLAFHLKELRKPLQRLESAIYKQLEKIEDEGSGSIGRDVEEVQVNSRRSKKRLPSK